MRVVAVHKAVQHQAVVRRPEAELLRVAVLQDKVVQQLPSVVFPARVGLLVKAVGRHRVVPLDKVGQPRKIGRPHRVEQHKEVVRPQQEVGNQRLLQVEVRVLVEEEQEKAELRHVDEEKHRPKQPQRPRKKNALSSARAVVVVQARAQEDLLRQSLRHAKLQKSRKHLLLLLHLRRRLQCNKSLLRMSSLTRYRVSQGLMMIF